MSSAQELESREFIIVVIGPVGSGKSAFIAKAAENHHEDTGQGFWAGSHTTDFEATRLAIGNYSDVILVDTPGFDGPTTSPTIILARASNWLRATYNRRATAILCFQSISDNRVHWIPHDNLAVLQRSCGGVAASKISLVTTMWDEVDEEVGVERLAELEDNFWRVMISRESRMFQHSNTSESAKMVLQEVTDDGFGRETGTAGFDGTHAHRNGSTRRRIYIFTLVTLAAVLSLGITILIL